MNQIASVRKRVVIVDDSRAIQTLLAQMLSTRLDYEIVGIAGNGAIAIEMIHRLKPDLVTIDLAMPYINGRQLLKALESFPTMRKVVISASICDNPAMKAGLENMGADVCVCKNEISRNPAEFCRMLSAMMRAPRNVKSIVSMARPGLAAPITGYPVPVDEQERLATLATLGLANGGADHRLDTLTERLVNSTSFSASIITFIDEHTQWIKSSYGLKIGPMAREQAICNHTICSDEPFIVDDTSADMRLAKLDVVLKGPMIRAYVGHPIIGSSGVRLGAICLLDTKPHRVTLKELTNLRSVAKITEELVEDRSILRKRAA